MTNRILLLAALGATSLGCTYKSDVVTICDPEANVSSMYREAIKKPGVDSAQRMNLLAEGITKALHTSKGRELFASFGKPRLTFSERIGLLRSEAAAVGLDRCKYADWLEEELVQGPYRELCRAGGVAAYGAKQPDSRLSPFVTLSKKPEAQRERLLDEAAEKVGVDCAAERAKGSE
jgi:hypothetical protein